MTEPAQKCENDNLYKRNFTPKLFIAFEMAYCCCFCFGGNLDFLQKSFITSSTLLKHFASYH